MSSHPNKGIFYTSLVLIPFLIMGMVENMDDGEAFILFIVILGCLTAAWKTAEEDSYFKLVGKNIAKEFKSRKEAQKERLKKNLDE